ncbi:hypothetical protein SARC_14347, partial [Sphaeroforma arctica JP610]
VCSEVVTHVGDVAKALVSQTEQSETLLQVIDKCWATHTHHMVCSMGHTAKTTLKYLDA